MSTFAEQLAAHDFAGGILPPGALLMDVLLVARVSTEDGTDELVAHTAGMDPVTKGGLVYVLTTNDGQAGFWHFVPVGEIGE